MGSRIVSSVCTRPRATQGVVAMHVDMHVGMRAASVFTPKQRKTPRQKRRALAAEGNRQKSWKTTPLPEMEQRVKVM